VNIFCLFSVGLAPPKKPLVFKFRYFLCEEHKASQSHAYVLVVFFTFLEVPHKVFTSLLLSTDSGQDKTLTHVKNVCILSCVCVWGGGDNCFNFVSFLFCFCLVFVSSLRTRP